MRVVAGKYRGREIVGPDSQKIRPTTDRIKETIFNILQGDVEDSCVLDLFSGSGALGIECLSRGASEVVFVDKNREAFLLTGQNLKGIDGNYKTILGDFLTVLRSIHRQFDLIFVDPPYAGTLGELAIEAIIDLDILAKGGIIIFEHGTEQKFTPTREKLKVRSKAMGSVTTEFISKKKIALLSGSFDPITRGHEAVIDEALRRFDEVVVACLVNPEKSYTLNSEERLHLVEVTIADKKGASAIYSEKSAVDVAKEVGADMLVRGVRGNSDLSYENEMSDFNRQNGVETMFIEIDGFHEISSTLVRTQMAQGDFHNLPRNVQNEYLKPNQTKPNQTKLN